jgi:NADH-quinone oxidoreductase subunit G
MVAAELARRLDGDLGFENIEAISEEIEALAPAYRGVTADVLARPAGRDGLVVPVVAVAVSIGSRAAKRLIDPMATPGIASVEEQGAPLRVGAATALGGEAERDDGAPFEAGLHGGEPHAAVGAEPDAAVETAVRPPVLGPPAAAAGPQIPQLEAGVHRLYVRRVLYDGGTLVASSPSLAPLAPARVLIMHPDELGRAGIVPGGRVRVRSDRGEIFLEAVGDVGVGRGIAVLEHNVLPGGLAHDDRDGADRASEDAKRRSVASILVAAGSVVTDVRVEAV